MIKTDVEYIKCKNSYYCIGSDHPDLEKGAFYEVISDNGDTIEVESEEFSRGQPVIITLDKNGNWTWPQHFETDGLGLLRKYKLVEMLF